MVSIITPCYNGEKTIGRLIESVIAQTYRPIEFIIVDDGSIDKTKNVIDNYKDKIENSGITFIYLYQENKGLGGAINAGLKLFTGEYFCWPDADDYLEPTSVEDRLEAFKLHPKCAVVTSDAYLRDSSSLDKVKGLLSSSYPHRNEPNQFELLLNGDSIFCSGCHMVKTDMFLTVNPNKGIFPARRGQNWQMLLPLYYKHDRFFLEKPLYNYINYPISMSKDSNDINSILVRYNEHEQIIINTLKMIEITQKTDLSNIKEQMKRQYTKYRMSIAFKYGDITQFNEQYKIKKQFGLNLKDFIMFSVINNSLLRSLYYKK